MKKHLTLFVLIFSILCTLLISCDNINEMKDSILSGIGQTGGSEGDNNESQSGNIALPSSVRVTFKSSAKTAINGVVTTVESERALTVIKGEKIEEPEAPTSEGSVFDGWYYGNLKWSFDEMTVNEDITLVARWIPIMHLVEFVDEGAETVTEAVPHGARLDAPDDPMKDGLTFEGWYNGDAKWSFDSDAVTEDLTLTAVWSAEIVYVLDGGECPDSNPSRIYTTDELPIKLEGAKKDGVVFAGWYLDEEFSEEITEIKAVKPHTVYAKWMENAIEYTVRVVSAGNMPLAGLTLNVYGTNGGAEAVATAKTDSDGSVKFYLKKADGYSVSVLGAPDGYHVLASYALTQDTLITLTSAPIVAEGHKAQYAVGDVMHDFTVSDVDGNEYTLSALLREKDMVMLNFWYTNCAFCAYEFPHINAAYNGYSADIEILAINDYDSVNTIKAYHDYLGTTLDFPLIPRNELSLANFPSPGYPTTVIIDRYGVICAIIVGSIPYEEVWNNLFKHFTAEDYQQRLVDDVTDFA